MGFLLFVVFAIVGKGKSNDNRKKPKQVPFGNDKKKGKSNDKKKGKSNDKKKGKSNDKEKGKSNDKEKGKSNDGKKGNSKDGKKGNSAEPNFAFTSVITGAALRRWVWRRRVAVWRRAWR